MDSTLPPGEHAAWGCKALIRPVSTVPGPASKNLSKPSARRLSSAVTQRTGDTICSPQSLRASFPLLMAPPVTLE